MLLTKEPNLIPTDIPPAASFLSTLVDFCVVSVLYCCQCQSWINYLAENHSVQTEVESWENLIKPVPMDHSFIQR